MAWSVGVAFDRLNRPYVRKGYRKLGATSHGRHYESLRQRFQ